MPSIVVSKKQYEQIKRDKKWIKVQTPLKGRGHKKHSSLFTFAPANWPKFISAALEKKESIKLDE